MHWTVGCSTCQSMLFQSMLLKPKLSSQNSANVPERHLSRLSYFLSAEFPKFSRNLVTDMQSLPPPTILFPSFFPLPLHSQTWLTTSICATPYSFIFATSCLPGCILLSLLQGSVPGSYLQVCAPHLQVPPLAPQQFCMATKVCLPQRDVWCFVATSHSNFALLLRDQGRGIPGRHPFQPSTLAFAPHQVCHCSPQTQRQCCLPLYHLLWFCLVCIVVRVQD